jgi:lambda family phage portal protein
LEVVDPDLIDEAFNRPVGTRTPEIRMGIEINQYGRPLAYHVWDQPLSMGGITPRRHMERVPAEEIIHLYRMDRPNLTRGVTWLAPVMFALNMLDGYEDAEITACRLAASAMGVFTRKDAGAEAPMGENNQIDFEANPGSFMFAPEGYDLTSWDPQHPNANYQAFVKGALRKIASGLGLSYNVLANDLEGVNYSSMRSGMGIERDLWRANQHWWVGAFLEPVYAEWMNMALLSGGLVLDSRDRRKFLAAKWSPRGWPPVDPLDDTDAGIKEVQTGLGTRTEMLAEQGRDYEETLELLKREKELADEYGVDVSGPKSEAAAPAKKPAGAKEKDAAEEDERTARNRVAVLVNGRNGHV